MVSKICVFWWDPKPFPRIYHVRTLTTTTSVKILRDNKGAAGRRNALVDCIPFGHEQGNELGEVIPSPAQYPPSFLSFLFLNRSLGVSDVRCLVNVHGYIRV